MPKHYFSSKTHTTSAVWKPNTAVQQCFVKHSASVKRNLIFLLPFTHSWHATAPLKTHRRAKTQSTVQNEIWARSSKSHVKFCLHMRCQVGMVYGWTCHTEIHETRAIKPDTPPILLTFMLQIQHSAPEIVRFYKPLSSNPNTVQLLEKFWISIKPRETESPAPNPRCS